MHRWKSNKDVTDLIISRLPKSDLITARDIAIACDYKSSCSIRAAIQNGDIPAVRLSNSGKYTISRSDAIKWIREQAQKGL